GRPAAGDRGCARLPRRAGFAAHLARRASPLPRAAGAARRLALGRVDEPRPRAGGPGQRREAAGAAVRAPRADRRAHLEGGRAVPGRARLSFLAELTRPASAALEAETAQPRDP